VTQIPTIVVHPGCPKSGTTTLQASIFPRIENIVYLGKQPGGQPGYFNDVVANLLHDVIGQDDARVRATRQGPATARRREQFADTADTFVLSNEVLVDDTQRPLFAPWPKDIYLKAKHLRDVLVTDLGDIANVQIMLTIRRQQDALPSFFAQIPYKYPQYYDPNLHSFVDFCLRRRQFGFGEFFNFDYLYTIYGELFGFENVWVFPMEGLFDESQPVERERFARLLQQPVEAVSAAFVDARRNTKRQEHHGETRYRFGRRAHWSIRPVRRLYHGLRGSLGHDPAALPGVRALKRHISRLGFERDQFTLSPELQGEIAEFYRATNTRLAERSGMDLAAYGYPVAT